LYNFRNFPGSDGGGGSPKKGASIFINTSPVIALIENAILYGAAIDGFPSHVLLIANLLDMGCGLLENVDKSEAERV
jgi:hypothetical protein